MPSPLPEPWLRGPLDGIDPLVSNLFYTFTQTREELAAHLTGISTAQVWDRPGGLAPAGFHIRHIGGAADRLGAYLRGQMLSPGQMSELAAESEPGASPSELLAELDARLTRLERDVARLDPETLRSPRSVGRMKLPSTAIGLIVHIAEHTQRHLGQAITTLKFVRAHPPGPAPAPPR